MESKRRWCPTLVVAVADSLVVGACHAEMVEGAVQIEGAEVDGGVGAEMEAGRQVAAGECWGG